MDDDMDHHVTWITVANVGDTPAKITGFGGDLAVRKNTHLEWTGTIDATVKSIDPIILKPGQRHPIPIQKRTSWNEEARFSAVAKLADAHLCVAGEIRYEDGNGIERLTGFLRIYDFDRESFVLSDHEEEDEYVD